MYSPLPVFGSTLKKIHVIGPVAAYAFDIGGQRSIHFYDGITFLKILMSSFMKTFLQK